MKESNIARVGVLWVTPDQWTSQCKVAFGPDLTGPIVTGPPGMNICPLGTNAPSFPVFWSAKTPRIGSSAISFRRFISPYIPYQIDISHARANNRLMNTSERLLLRGGEVAEMIGCSRAMAYRLMQRGTIPVLRVPGGKTVRVPREALATWIKENTRAGAAA